jgi:hypothetical protein
MVKGFQTEAKETKEELFCYKAAFGGLDFRLLGRNLWIKNSRTVKVGARQGKQQKVVE